MKTALIIVMILSLIVAIAAFVFIIIDYKQEKKLNEQAATERANRENKRRKRGMTLDESELDGMLDEEEVKIEVS